MQSIDVFRMYQSIVVTICLLLLAQGEMISQWSNVTARDEEITKTQFVTSRGPCYTEDGNTFRYDSSSSRWFFLLPQRLIAARDSSLIFQNNLGDFYVSTDGARTITKKSLPYSHRYHQFLIRGDTIVVLTDTAIFVSVGTTSSVWTQIGSAFPSGIHGRDITLHWYGTNILIEERTRTYTVRCVSLDDTWLPVTEEGMLTSVSSDNDILLCNYSGKLLLIPTHDHAETMDIGSPQTKVIRFNTAIIAISNERMAISRDEGRTWTVQSNLPYFSLDSLRHFTYRDSLYIYLGRSVGWRATDISLQRWFVVSMSSALISARYANVHDTLLIWLANKQLLSIPLNAQSRPEMRFSDDAHPVATFADNRGTILRFMDSRLLLSQDGGRQWDTTTFNRNVVRAGISDGIVWHIDGGLHLSSDGGRSWGEAVTPSDNGSQFTAAYHLGAWIFTRDDECYLQAPHQPRMSVTLPQSSVIQTFSNFNGMYHLASNEGIYRLRSNHWTFMADAPATLAYRTLRPNDTHYYGIDMSGRPVRWQPGSAIEYIGDMRLASVAVSFTGPYVIYAHPTGAHIYHISPTTSSLREPIPVADPFKHHMYVVNNDRVDLTTFIPESSAPPSVTIYDASGSVVRSQHDTWYVDTQGLSCGVYGLSITRHHVTRTLLFLIAQR